MNQSEIFQFSEKVESDDPICKDAKSFPSSTAIVIDNGSGTIKGGWAGEQNPRLYFPTWISKVKGNNGSEISVGNNVRKADFARGTVKSSFDENGIVFNFDCQEYIFDHIFAHLGIKDDKINHPICMTEPLCNPNWCRKNMSEILFECYQSPSVAYGIDGLFSFYANRIANFQNQISSFGNQNGLIINSGFSSTTVIPIIDNCPMASESKRIGLGGFHCTDYMQKLFTIKYPLHRNNISWERATQMKEIHSYVAEDYIQHLDLFAQQKKGENNDDGESKTIQLPYVAQTTTIISEEEKQRKHAMRVEQGNRLKEMGQKRRLEKIQEKEIELGRLQSIQSLKETDLGSFENALKMEETTEDKLEKLIEKTKSEVEKSKGIENGEIKLEKKQKKTETDEKFEENPEEFVSNLKRRRREIEEGKEKREKINSQTTGRRNTVAQSKRMKAITGIAFDQTESENDNFGMNDEDWEIYLKAVRNLYNLLI
eukprot:TRINITY_DN4064_c0_g2_i1.p1 TRINITY_DN4064_c0_g2~~TRINITY_DN4064_c0_g2_i1.p1  ORF type:complete len:484 (+),score=148.39 TRINITY_DN4064_c0_g2_i1:112-1563(+)